MSLYPRALAAGALLFLFLGCASAPVAEYSEPVAKASCPKPPTAPSKERVLELVQSAKNRGVLFVISKDDLIRGHLYGTIHAGREQWMVPGPKIQREMRAADVIAVELDVLDPDLRKKMTDMASAKGKTVQLTSGHQQKLDGLFQALCAPKALRATNNLGQMYMDLMARDMRQANLHFEYGVDLVLIGMGKSWKKTIHSLETAEQQIAALQAPASIVNGKKVDESLDQLIDGTVRRKALAMADAWAAGDLKGVLKGCEPNCNLFNNSELGANRNKVMADGIDTLIKGGKRVFSAVGVLHLTGDASVQRLLEEKGYEVWRSPF